MTIAEKTRIIESALDLPGAAERCQAAERQALDTFLAYDLEMRAMVWRSMSERGRNLIVSAMLIRAYDDWSETSVDQWVAKYNQRWGSEPTAEDLAWKPAPPMPLTDASIAGALETLATTAGIALRSATSNDDRSFARRELNAANKAHSQLLAGVRAQWTESGAWLVSSATKAGAVYRVTSTGCCCEAGINGAPCWHASLVTATEMALNTVDQVEEFEPAYPEPIDMGRRLASARALLMVA